MPQTPSIILGRRIRIFPTSSNGQGFLKRISLLPDVSKSHRNDENPKGVRALTARHSKGATFQEGSVPRKESRKVRLVPSGLGGRCYRLIFVRGHSFGGEVPEEQQPRGRTPGFNTASPRHQGSYHRGSRELGLSEMTLAPIPTRVVDGYITEDGAYLVIKSSEKDN